jgi:hypothetical protein
MVGCGDRNRQRRMRLVKRSIRLGPTLQRVSAKAWLFLPYLLSYNMEGCTLDSCSSISTPTRIFDFQEVDF